MKRIVSSFLALAAIALGVLTFWLLVWGVQEIREVNQAPRAEAQPPPQPLPEAVVKGAGRLTLEDVQVFDRFPVFWVGPEFKGHPVSKILYIRSPGSPDGLIPPQEFVRIQYGTCEPGEGPPEEEGGCIRPLTIYSEPLCYNPPGRLARGARQGPPLEVRGAQTQLVQSPPGQPIADTGDTHFYFSQSTVIISAAEGSGTTIEAFESLVGVNQLGLAVAPSATDQLAPPMPEEECQNFALPPIEPLATPASPALPTHTPNGHSDSYANH